VSEERLSDLIDPALRGLGVRGQVREERLRLALADVVGDSLASLCRAQRLDRGVLLIATANTALAHQLQMDAPRVIDALNRRVGQDLVRRIRFTGL
jgi:predicted nucleic acid-binding Zn ribbon protein